MKQIITDETKMKAMAFDYVTEQVQEKRVPDIGLLSLSTMVTALNEYISGLYAEQARHTKARGGVFERQ